MKTEFDIVADYEPGTCNIDDKESKKRLVIGAVSFLNAAILTAVLFIFPSFTPIYIGIFILAFTGYLGVIQYRKNFCAGLGLKGKFHIGEEEEVSGEEDLLRDRKEAVKIVVTALLASATTTYLIYLI